MTLRIALCPFLFAAIHLHAQASNLEVAKFGDDSFVGPSQKIGLSPGSEFGRTDWLIFAVEERVIVKLANGRKVNRRFKSANSECVELFDARKRVHVIPWSEIDAIYRKERGSREPRKRNSMRGIGKAGLVAVEIVGISVGTVLIGGVAVLSVIYSY